MTIEQIDKEIQRLSKMRERKIKALLEGGNHIGELYRLTDGSIGKIQKSRMMDGKMFFTGRSLWFDDEEYFISNEEDTFSIEEYEPITPEEFLSTLQEWGRKIAGFFQVKRYENEKEKEKER